MAASRQSSGVDAAGSGAEEPDLRVAVYSLEPPDQACAFVRLLGPLEAARALRGGDLELHWGCSMRGTHAEIDLSPLQRADLVIVQRLFAQPMTSAPLQEIFRSGCPVIFDLDDWLLETPEGLPERERERVKTSRETLHWALSHASAVTTPSEELAGLLRALNADVTVIPNAVPRALLAAGPLGTRRRREPRAPGSGPLALGFVGTPGHLPDLERIEPALLALHERYGKDLRLVFFGCASPRLRSLAGSEFRPLERSYARYLQQLAELELDLAVSPLAGSLFNDCKSPIKWLEFSALGIPAVYSDLPPYRSLIDPGRTGWLCPDDPDAWTQALVEAIESPSLRTAIGERAARAVQSRHTLDHSAPRLLQTLQRVAHPRRGTRVESRGRDPLCSIVIPVYGRAELTDQCLRSLLELRERTPSEIVVVDNASPDDTPRVLERFASRIRVLRNRENLGFARACNQGARAARGDSLVFLNNDTIAQPGWLDALQNAGSLPGVGIAGSKLLYPDGSIQHAGVTICGITGGPYHMYMGMPGDVPAVNRRRELNAVTGACMWTRRELFEALDGFDEGYLNSFEDIDLCLRARQRGERVLYEPASWLYHLESQTPGRKANDAANLERYFSRWWNPIWSDEGAQYASDGVYLALERTPDGGTSMALRVIESERERRAWWRVCRIQRSIIERGFDAVFPWLRPPPEWPLEDRILLWASRLCVAHERAERARELLALSKATCGISLADLSQRTRTTETSPQARPDPRDDSWLRALNAQLRLL